MSYRDIERISVKERQGFHMVSDVVAGQMAVFWNNTIIMGLVVKYTLQRTAIFSPASRYCIKYVHFRTDIVYVIYILFNSITSRICLK